MTPNLYLSFRSEAGIPFNQVHQRAHEIVGDIGVVVNDVMIGIDPEAIAAGKAPDIQDGLIPVHTELTVEQVMEKLLGRVKSAKPNGFMGQYGVDKETQPVLALIL